MLAPSLPTMPTMPPWFADAACATYDPEDWYADGKHDGDRIAHAVAVCRGCPVQTPCLTYALENDERWGVWAGTTPKQRRALSRKTLELVVA